MKELLIIFVVLLVLLMLISTFGGTIRQKESFVQASGITDEELPPVPHLFTLPPLPTFDVAPSKPPFDIPAPTVKSDTGYTNLTNTVEPFDNNHKYAVV